jgi:hypothetical protein
MYFAQVSVGLATPSTGLSVNRGVRNEWLKITFMCRPACRIIQTGTLSTSSPRAARSNRGTASLDIANGVFLLWSLFDFKLLDLIERVTSMMDNRAMIYFILLSLPQQL